MVETLTAINAEVARIDDASRQWVALVERDHQRELARMVEPEPTPEPETKPQIKQTPNEWTW